jgi:hypothetical protein
VEDAELAEEAERKVTAAWDGNADKAENNNRIRATPVAWTRRDPDSAPELVIARTRDST